MLQCSRFFDRVLLLLVFFLVICSGNFRNAVTGGVGIARGVGIGEIFYVGIAKCREKRCRESRVYCIKVGRLVGQEVLKKSPDCVRIVIH